MHCENKTNDLPAPSQLTSGKSQFYFTRILVQLTGQIKLPGRTGMIMKSIGPIRHRL
ncbi:hypothetical protein CY34DRAFT_808568 [Suillus luteus UH-Slu-Lm8-n1]|uniref:Unplaced genomic scaffold CY34scaffold_224, whole genome shotgun sequence n=1 Tax=Suillus luteus UH-Slu-Lm8-n1 TaxID=930992 RepID=A0A0D0AM49_9AGAM|nr:hypothetical protein CY34DRAFT_808568 [Suillus luteus UH-Slu-Lm8-n1]